MTQLRVAVTSADHMDGPADAGLVLVEYGDYECPHCGAAHKIVQRLKHDLRPNLLFVYRNFPLTEVHPYAFPAAAAAEAAGLQTQFWQMHDRLFEHQDRLDPASLIDHARALRLNVDQFVDDAQRPDLQSRIAADFEGGARSGVNGTPTFFANGVRVDGGYSYDILAAALTGSRV